MLQSIRDRIQGLVAGVIILFLCMTFGIWGIEKYLNSGKTVVVAKVNGHDIELPTFQTTYQRLRQRAQAELGDNFDPKVWGEQATKVKALDYLIEEQLLLQAAEDARLKVSDAQVAANVTQSPTFQVDGKFSKERYSQIVNALGFNELGFEQQARKDISVQQLRAGVAMSSFVTDAEAQRLQQLRAQTRDVGYATVSLEKFKDGITLTQAEIEEYFKAHQEQYRTNEKLALEYVLLSLDSIIGEVKVADAALQTYYDAHQAQYTVEEQRSANHILVQVKKDATPEETEAARKKASDLRESIVNGKKFEDVAKESSDDVGSKAEGGETGLFGRGVMAPEFEQAVFALKPGELSEPVKTEFGYHIIRVKEIKPGGLRPLSEARADVEAAYRKEQAEATYYERAEQFSNTVYEHPDSLAAAADALGLKVEKTELLTREDLAAKFSPAVVDAAFEPEVLTDGLSSPPVEVSDTKVVAIKLLQHEASRLRTLDEVRDDVVKALTLERAHDAATKRGAELVERLQKGEDLNSLMASEGLSWHTAKNIDRNGGDVSRAVARAAFKVTTPKPGEFAYAGIPVGTGDYAIIQVANVVTPPLEKLPTEQLTELKRQAGQTRTLLSWHEFVDALKSHAKITTHVENL